MLPSAWDIGINTCVFFSLQTHLNMDPTTFLNLLHGSHWSVRLIENLFYT
jgi:hypothetical protein